MRGGIYLKVFVLLILSGCTKFEDAEMTKRNSFVHFFSSETNYLGVAAETDTDGGFIITGEIRNRDSEPDALIIKTDATGRRVWEQIINKAIINAIKPYSEGYILVGDSIQFNTGASGVALSELENSYARLLLMDSQGAIVGKHTSTGSVRVGNDTLTIDYHGSAFDMDATGNILVLGSYRVPGDFQSTFVSAFNPTNVSDSIWYQSYEALDRDLFNCNALHVTRTSSLVWASRIYTQVGNLAREFAGISEVLPNSTFKNYAQFGESDLRNHSMEDIQKSAVGYCAIGTYAETNGLNGNMYFLHLDSNLDVLTELYIDGEELMLNDAILNPQSKTSSNSLDEGLAVVSTVDGFVLAGTLTSTPAVGNGGKDILLLKVNPTGKLLWKKLIGGSGDETVSSIRQTDDQGLLLCGTNTVNGLSTIMLIKTDRNGNLDK